MGGQALMSQQARRVMNLVQRKLACLRHVRCDWVGALFSGAMVSFAVVTAHLRPAYAAPECFDRNNVRIVISGQLFSIPVRYHPLILMSGGKVVAPVHRKPRVRCNEKFFKSNSEPIEAYKVSLRGLRDVSDPNFPALHRVSLQLWSSEPFSFDHREIKQFKDKVERSGTLVEKLPQLARFYAFAQLEGTQFYKSPFMAAPGGIKTPSGNPIVFQCYGAVIAP
jgi:hypothetical protein